jgi:ubiquinone/menaquinone biosynthesis C-methylase UbiE
VSQSASELNQRAFSQQAPTFADRRFNQVLTGASDWVFAGVPRHPRDVVLDVAAGTGLGGRALAPDVRQVIALDATEAMLEVGRSQAAAAQVENILFMRGDAAALPFLDSSFRIVLCRYALHHFPDPRVELTEMRRVLVPRGWLGLADMVASEAPETAARQNHIERLRDPSHAKALSASGLQDMLVRCGFEVAGAETREVRRPLDPWLTQTATAPAAAAEIRRRLETDLDGRAPTGLSPRREADGSLSFAHTLTSLLVLNADA